MKVVAYVLAAVVLSGTASASDGPKDKSSAGGAPSGSSSSTGSATGSQTTQASEDYSNFLDARSGYNRSNKWWEVGAVWETHALLVQNDLEGAASNRLMNFLYGFVRANLSKYDQLSLGAGLTQGALSDADETPAGVRATDLKLSYSRRIPLPRDFTIKIIAAVTAPTSYYSQRASLITAPTLTIDVSKSYKGWSFDVRAFGGPYIVQYSTAIYGANPNAKGSLGGTAAIDYSFWFHKALSVGIDGYVAYIWYYDVANGGMPPGGNNFMGSVSSMPQTVQQAYGGEVFVRYDVPPRLMRNVKMDFTVALANGDPTLGYNSVLHDGIDHIYALWRLNGEVYGAIGLRY